jgi:hypothetical protein
VQSEAAFFAISTPAKPIALSGLTPELSPKPLS